MIVRRRRSKNFTILENEVVEDRRLALDEIGLLAWLRSRPDHWEVSRAYICKHFKIGRDKVARIFRSLIETGWMVREETQPGTPASYIVRDEPGAEVELTDDEVADIEGPSAAKNNSPVETVASLSQSGFPATGNPPAGDPPTENPAAIVRTESKELTPKPPAGAFNETGTKRFQQFKIDYPDGIVDLDAAEREYANLTEPEQIACGAAVLAYASRCKRRREKSMKAHLFIRKRAWNGLLANPETAATPSLHMPGSSAARALMALGRVARYRPFALPDGRLSYQGEITPRLLAMADAPEGGEVYQRGSSNYGAWREFVREIFEGRALPDLNEMHAPWPWPPGKDGKIYAGTDPPSLVPGTLATQQGADEFERG